jgi:histidinol-phosphate aminotransferase
VIVDEAYIDFVDRPGHRSMVDLALAGENVIVSRTASKLFGLAGLRCGFAVARPDIIARLQQYVTGDPNVFGLLAAEASLRDTEYQAFVQAKNREGRALLLDALQRLGRRTMASQTNFVFFHAGKPVEQLQAHFAERGFLIGRPFPPYSDWARVSIGTPEEMQQFVALLPAALA